MNNKFKMIDNVKVYNEFGTWYCNYGDYLEAGKPKGEEEFCNWCDDNSIYPCG